MFLLDFLYILMSVLQFMVLFFKLSLLFLIDLFLGTFLAFCFFVVFGEIFYDALVHLLFHFYLVFGLVLLFLLELFVMVFEFL